MTAKEMFKKLGYELIFKDNGVMEYQNNIPKFDCKLEVYFWLDDKVIYHNLWKCDEQMKGSSVLTIELYQAITQQMKELGWIE